jgi:hypothetical protein
MTLDDIKTQATHYYQKAKVYGEQHLIKKFFLIGVGG